MGHNCNVKGCLELMMKNEDVATNHIFLTSQFCFHTVGWGGGGDCGI